MLQLEPKDRYKDCIIGQDVWGWQLIYDSEKVIKVLMEHDGMTEEEALEYFEYNIAGAYVGEEGPIFIWRNDGSKK